MTVRIFPDEIILGNLVIIGNLVIMRCSVHLCQRKFFNKHLRSRNTRFLSIQFTYGRKYMYEYRHVFSGSSLFWTVVECLDGTYVPYVVSLHTERCDKQCVNVSKNEY
jgi:hypothetical protein